MVMIRKKKLCILIGSHWAARIGGAQFQVKCLLDELQKTDEFDISYLTRRMNPSYEAVGYEIIKISDAKLVKRGGFFFDAPRIIKSLNEKKPDVIYQRDFSAYTGIAAYFAKRNGCKMVWHISSDYDVSPFIMRPAMSTIFKFIDKKIGEYGIKNCDCIISQTRQQGNLLKRNYRRRPTAIIQNFHPFPKETVQKEPPVKIVWVGNFKPNKRPEMFVRLAEDLCNHEGIEFIMIGRPGIGGNYYRLHKRIAKLQNLRYEGECSIEEVNRILAKAHIFVNTSLVEGFPNTFIQAWMRKVPVVSLGVNTDGIFEDKQIGFCSSTYEEMLGNVVRLIRSPEIRATMGGHAQTHAFKYNSTRNAKALVSLLRS